MISSMTESRKPLLPFPFSIVLEVFTFQDTIQLIVLAKLSVCFSHVEKINFLFKAFFPIIHQINYSLRVSYTNTSVI